MPRSNERGIAMILALFMVLVLSTLGSSLMFLAQTDTWTSSNYRLMAQSRYVAESGVQKAAHHLLYSYGPPGSALDPLANYNLTVSPVTYNGKAVVLSSDPDVPSNYPIAAVQSAFSAAAQGTLNLGTASATYRSTATLLSMRQLIDPFTGVPTTMQTWQVSAKGTVNGPRSSRVDVAAVIDRPLMPAFRYGAFATNNACGALDFRNDATTNSYDSSAALQGGQPVLSNSSGNVATNGNLEQRNNSAVHGMLSTPGTGVGACSNGNVTARTIVNGSPTIDGLVQLPQSATYATPPAPSPLPPTNNQDFSSCTGLSYCSTPSPGVLTITPPSPTSPVTFGDIRLDSGSKTVHLNAGIYIVNSLRLSDSAKIVVDSGPVVFQLAGQGSGNVIQVRNNAVIDTSFDPTKLQFIFGGSGSDKIVIEDDAKVSATVYAPNADATLRNDGHFYGGLIVKTLLVRDDAALHYDRQLQGTSLATAGSYTMSSFTWKSF